MPIVPGESRSPSFGSVWGLDSPRNHAVHVGFFLLCRMGASGMRTHGGAWQLGRVWFKLDGHRGRARGLKSVDVEFGSSSPSVGGGGPRLWGSPLRGRRYRYSIKRERRFIEPPDQRSSSLGQA